MANLCAAQILRPLGLWKIWVKGFGDLEFRGSGLEGIRIFISIDQGLARGSISG